MKPFPSFTKEFHIESYPSISPDRADLSAHGKIVLITGGGSGIGQATALAFARAKAKVIIICGRRVERLEQTKLQIEALDSSTEVVVQKLDVTSAENVDIVFKAVHQNAGPVDIVINSAGHLSDSGTIRDTSPANFWDSFEVNVKGAFLISQAFIKHCVRNDGKQRVLILLSSFLAHMSADRVSTAPASYGCAKIAEAKLAEYLAVENYSGLRVYALQPGVVKTEMNAKSLASAPQEVADSVVFDHTDLPGHFMLWLASSRGAAVPSGKFLWVNWDVDELEARSEEMKANSDLLTMTLGGWPFTNKA